MFRQDAYALLALALFGVVFTIYAVIGSTPFFPPSLQSLSGECPENAYYPATRRPVMDEFEAEWYSSILLGLHEEPLFHSKDDGRRTVRFSYFRAFSAPVMVRTTELEDGRVRLFATWVSGHDGCPTAGNVCRVDRILSAAEQAGLTRAQTFLERASYGCPSGIDGSMWLIESSGQGEYRFWSEWSPQQGELKELALTMLDLTGWRLTAVY